MEDDLVGSLVDARYRVERRVGAGGSGTVYAAEHIHLGVPVALKVLHVDERGDAGRKVARVERFLAEARILQHLRHANIVSALGAGFVTTGRGETPYIALAWCGGVTLAEILAGSRGKPGRSSTEAWRLLEPVVDAVAHAHAQGITHCDLAPSNVMVEEVDGAHLVRVIDFGIAQLARDASVSTGGEGRAFTREYAAPEQISGAGTTPATDVHALGLLLVELLSNRPPYGDGDPGLAAIDPERPSAARLGADAGPYGGVLARALALAPRDRFANAGELAIALREATRETVSTTGGGMAVQIPPPPVTAPPRFRRRNVLVAGGAVLLLGAVGAGAVLARQPTAPIASMDVDEIRARLAKQGYKVTSYNRSPSAQNVSVMVGSAIASVWINQWMSCEGDAATCRTAISDDMIRLANTDPSHAQHYAYASDFAATLVVMSTDPQTSERLRDVVLAGRKAEVRGTVAAGEHPSGEGRSTGQLANMGPEELSTQLRQAGFRVTWSGRGRDGIVCHAAYLLGDLVGSATLYRGHVAEIVRSIEREPEPFAWAVAGDSMLMLRGKGAVASTASLQKVIAGTDAKVGGSRP